MAGAKSKGTAVHAVGCLDETWGLVNSLSKKHEGESEEVVNGANDIKAIILSKFKTVINVSMTLLVEADSPVDLDKMGEVFTLKVTGAETLKCLIDPGQEVSFTPGKASTASFTATHYPEMTECQA